MEGIKVLVTRQCKELFLKKGESCIHSAVSTGKHHLSHVGRGCRIPLYDFLSMHANNKLILKLVCVFDVSQGSLERWDRAAMLVGVIV